MEVLRSRNDVARHLAGGGQILFFLRFVFRSFLFHRCDRLFVLFAVQHLHHQRHHFREILALALLFVLVGFQASLQIDETALVQVLLADLAQAPPGLNIDPPGGLFRFPVRALPAVADGQAEVRHLLPVRGEAAFRVFSEASDQLHTVQSWYFIFSFSLKSGYP